MKKSTIIFGLAALGLFVSCKDEVIVPVEDKKMADSLTTQIGNQQDQIIQVNTELNEIRIINDQLSDVRDSLQSFNYYNTKVLYTVNVMSFANSVLSNGRTSGLSGATVTVDQNGNKQTKTTDGGIAVFEVLNGSATVYVSAADHGEVEYSVSVGYSDYDDGDVRHASNQIFLYPNAGSAGSAIISGKVMMNSSTLDDTLARVYGTGASVGTYVSKPGSWTYGNYTQNNYWMEPSTIYGYPSGTQIAFDKAPNTLKIYAVPSISYWASNNESNYGYINSITYKGIISSAKVDDNGNYSIPVFSSAEGVTITLSTDEYIGAHTRLTTGQGSTNEAGSTEKTFKYFDTAAGTASDLVRRVVTENNWRYRSRFDFNGSQQSSSINHEIRTNQTLTQNIYLFPNTRF